MSSITTLYSKDALSMFDLGIAKLGVIGIVALIALGPTRLPQVARTLGALLGRAQRYIHAVQAEVSQQLELDALHQVRNHFYESTQAATQALNHTLHPPKANGSWDTQQASFDTRRHTARHTKFQSMRTSMYRPYSPLLYRTSASYPYSARYRRLIRFQAARAKKHPL